MYMYVFYPKVFGCQFVCFASPCVVLLCLHDYLFGQFSPSINIYICYTLISFSLYNLYTKKVLKKQMF